VDGTFHIIASGPYDTAAEYLRDHYAVTNDDNPWSAAGTVVTKAAV
jgi:hypothetical protein